MDKGIMVDGLAVLREEVLEFCGIKGVLGRECKTCDPTQICLSQQMSGEVETCSELLMAPQIVASGVRVSGRRSRPKKTKLRAGVRGWWRTSSA